MIAPEIATSRLLLRQLQARDAEAIAAHLSNWNVVRWLSQVPWPYTPADARAYFDRIAGAEGRPGHAVRAIDLAGTLVGMIGIETKPPGPALGYWLAEPYWGHGLASEAAAALVGAAFEDGITSIYSGTFVGNVASARIQRNLGFVETGRGLQYSRSLGRDEPHIDTRLDRAAWVRARAKPTFADQVLVVDD